MAQYVFNPNHYAIEGYHLNALAVAWGKSDANLYPVVYPIDWGGYFHRSYNLTPKPGLLESSIAKYGNMFAAMLTGDSYLSVGVAPCPYPPLIGASATVSLSAVVTFLLVNVTTDLPSDSKVAYGLYARGSGDETTAAAGRNGYLARINTSTNLFELSKLVAGTVTVLATAAIPAGIQHQIRLDCNGTTIRAKIWAITFNGTDYPAEPSAWDISITDATFTGSGDCGVVCSHVAGTAITPWLALSMFMAGTAGDACPEPKTWDEQQSYLNNDEARIFLVEASVQYSGATEAKVCLSKGSFVSGPTDDPPNFSYEDCVLALPAYSSTAPDKYLGEASTSLGDMVLENNNGVRDSWVTWNWGGRKCKIFVGGLGWKKWDFRLITATEVSDIASDTGRQVALRMRDPGATLEANMLKDVIGGTGPNKDLPTPWAIGRCYNIPLIYRGLAFDYSIAYGRVYNYSGGSYQTITVRDSGLPIAGTLIDTPSTGFYGFTPSVALSGVGQLTLDTGVSNNPLAGMPALIARSFVFDSGATSTTNNMVYTGQRGGGFNDFALQGLNSVGAVGFYIAQQKTHRAGLTEFMSQVLAFWGFTPYGQVVWGRVANAYTPSHALIEDDIMEIKVVTILPPKSPDVFVYRLNQTNQANGLVGAVSASDRAKYSADGESVTVNATAPSNVTNLRPSERVKTALVGYDQTGAAFDVRVPLSDYAQAHTATQWVIEVTLKHNVGYYWVGQGVTVTHSRFNLEGGVTGLIVGVRNNLDGWATTLRVLIKVSGGLPMSGVRGPAVFDGTTYANISEPAPSASYLGG